MILLYKILFILFAVIGSPFIGLMLVFSKKRRKTFLYRCGIRVPIQDIDSRPYQKKPIWIHALSVGEVLSATPLVYAMIKMLPETPLVFSATTATGYRMATSRFGPYVKSVFYFPFDAAFSVKRIADAAAPGLVILVETDLWPCFLHEMKKRGIPTVLVNARISPKSFRGYRRLRFFMGPVLERLSHICAQSSDDFDRLIRLGVSTQKVTVTGNLKFDQATDPKSPADISVLKQRLGIQPDRPILLAGSTHGGEEDTLRDVFSRLKSDFSDLFLIIAPRNPDRAASICQRFRAAGWVADVMDDIINDAGPRNCRDVLVVDRIGQLTGMYAVADIAFIGGSLVNAGGHNPLEPAACSKPILFGPDMSDFKEIAQMLVSKDAGILVRNGDTLRGAVHMLLSDTARARSMGVRAYSVFCTHTGATDKTMAVVKECLGELEAI